MINNFQCYNVPGLTNVDIGPSNSPIVTDILNSYCVLVAVRLVMITDVELFNKLRVSTSSIVQL